MLFPAMLSLFNSLRFEEPEGSGGAPTEPADGDKSVSLTQAELDRMIQAEKAKAKRSGRKEFEDEMASKLGIPLEQAQQIIAERKQREDAEKSEAQKAKEAAEAAKAEADQLKASAALERHTARVERKLIKAGVNPDQAEDLTNLVRAEVGADDDALDEAVSKVQEKFPALFGATADGGRPRPVGTDTKAPAPKKLTPESAAERGKQRAAARNPQKIAS